MSRVSRHSEGPSGGFAAPSSQMRRASNVTATSNSSRMDNDETIVRRLMKEDDIDTVLAALESDHRRHVTLATRELGMFDTIPPYYKSKSASVHGAAGGGSKDMRNAKEIGGEREREGRNERVQMSESRSRDSAQPIRTSAAGGGGGGGGASPSERRGKGEIHPSPKHASSNSNHNSNNNNNIRPSDRNTHEIHEDTPTGSAPRFVWRPSRQSPYDSASGVRSNTGSSTEAKNYADPDVQHNQSVNRSLISPPPPPPPPPPPAAANSIPNQQRSSHIKGSGSVQSSRDRNGSTHPNSRSSSNSDDDDDYTQTYRGTSGVSASATATFKGPIRNQRVAAAAFGGASRDGPLSTSRNTSNSRGFYDDMDAATAEDDFNSEYDGSGSHSRSRYRYEPQQQQQQRRSNEFPWNNRSHTRHPTPQESSDRNTRSPPRQTQPPPPPSVRQRPPPPPPPARSPSPPEKPSMYNPPQHDAYSTTPASTRQRQSPPSPAPRMPHSYKDNLMGNPTSIAAAGVAPSSSIGIAFPLGGAVSVSPLSTVGNHNTTNTVNATMPTTTGTTFNSHSGSHGSRIGNHTHNNNNNNNNINYTSNPEGGGSSFPMEVSASTIGADGKGDQYHSHSITTHSNSPSSSPSSSSQKFFDDERKYSQSLEKASHARNSASQRENSRRSSLSVLTPSRQRLSRQMQLTRNYRELAALCGRQQNTIGISRSISPSSSLPPPPPLPSSKFVDRTRINYGQSMPRPLSIPTPTTMTSTNTTNTSTTSSDEDIPQPHRGRYDKNPKSTRRGNREDSSDRDDGSSNKRFDDSYDDMDFIQDRIRILRTPSQRRQLEKEEKGKYQRRRGRKDDDDEEDFEDEYGAKNNKNNNSRKIGMNHSAPKNKYDDRRPRGKRIAANRSKTGKKRKDYRDSDYSDSDYSDSEYESDYDEEYRTSSSSSSLEYDTAHTVTTEEASDMDELDAYPSVSSTRHHGGGHPSKGRRRDEKKDPRSSRTAIAKNKMRKNKRGGGGDSDDDDSDDYEDEEEQEQQERGEDRRKGSRGWSKNDKRHHPDDYDDDEDEDDDMRRHRNRGRRGSSQMSSSASPPRRLPPRIIERSQHRRTRTPPAAAMQYSGASNPNNEGDSDLVLDVHAFSASKQDYTDPLHTGASQATSMGGAMPYGAGVNGFTSSASVSPNNYSNPNAHVSVESDSMMRRTDGSHTQEGVNHSSGSALPPPHQHPRDATGFTGAAAAPSGNRAKNKQFTGKDQEGRGEGNSSNNGDNDDDDYGEQTPILPRSKSYDLPRPAAAPPYYGKLSASAIAGGSNNNNNNNNNNNSGITRSTRSPSPRHGGGSSGNFTQEDDAAAQRRMSPALTPDKRTGGGGGGGGKIENHLNSSRRSSNAENSPRNGTDRGPAKSSKPNTKSSKDGAPSNRGNNYNNNNSNNSPRQPSPTSQTATPKPSSRRRTPSLANSVRSRSRNSGSDSGSYSYSYSYSYTYGDDSDFNAFSSDDAGAANSHSKGRKTVTPNPALAKKGTAKKGTGAANTKMAALGRQSTTAPSNVRKRNNTSAPLSAKGSAVMDPHKKPPTSAQASRTGTVDSSIQSHASSLNPKGALRRNSAPTATRVPPPPPSASSNIDAIMAGASSSSYLLPDFNIMSPSKTKRRNSTGSIPSPLRAEGSAAGEAASNNKRKNRKDKGEAGEDGDDGTTDKQETKKKRVNYADGGESKPLSSQHTFNSSAGKPPLSESPPGRKGMTPTRHRMNPSERKKPNVSTTSTASFKEPPIPARRSTAAPPSGSTPPRHTGNSPASKRGPSARGNTASQNVSRRQSQAAFEPSMDASPAARDPRKRVAPLQKMKSVNISPSGVQQRKKSADTVGVVVREPMPDRSNVPSASPSRGVSLSRQDNVAPYRRDGRGGGLQSQYPQQSMVSWGGMISNNQGGSQAPLSVMPSMATMYGNPSREQSGWMRQPDQMTPGASVAQFPSHQFPYGDSTTTQPPLPPRGGPGSNPGLPIVSWDLKDPSRTLLGAQQGNEAAGSQSGPIEGRRQGKKKRDKESLRMVTPPTMELSADSPWNAVRTLQERQHARYRGMGVAPPTAAATAAAAAAAALVATPRASEEATTATGKDNSGALVLATNATPPAGTTVSTQVQLIPSTTAPETTAASEPRARSSSLAAASALVHGKDIQPLVWRSGESGTVASKNNNRIPPPPSSSITSVRVHVEVSDTGNTTNNDILAIEGRPATKSKGGSRRNISPSPAPNAAGATPHPPSTVPRRVLEREMELKRESAAEAAEYEAAPQKRKAKEVLSDGDNRTKQGKRTRRRATMPGEGGQTNASAAAPSNIVAREVEAIDHDATNNDFDYDYNTEGDNNDEQNDVLKYRSHKPPIGAHTAALMAARISREEEGAGEDREGNIPIGSAAYPPHITVTQYNNSSAEAAQQQEKPSRRFAPVPSPTQNTATPRFQQSPSPIAAPQSDRRTYTSNPADTSFNQQQQQHLRSGRQEWMSLSPPSPMAEVVVSPQSTCSLPAVSQNAAEVIRISVPHLTDGQTTPPQKQQQQQSSRFSPSTARVPSSSQTYNGMNMDPAYHAPSYTVSAAAGGGYTVPSSTSSVVKGNSWKDLTAMNSGAHSGVPSGGGGGGAYRGSSVASSNFPPSAMAAADMMRLRSLA